MELSRDEPQAEVVALLGRARHFYGRNDAGDCDRGRQDHRAALGLLDPKIQGHDVSYHQMAQIHFDSVLVEQTVGDSPEMFKAIWLCWAAIQQIHTPWRFQACRNPLFGFLAQWGLMPMLMASPEHTQGERDALQLGVNNWYMELTLMRQQQQQAQNGYAATDPPRYGQHQPGEAQPAQA